MRDAPQSNPVAVPVPYFVHAMPLGAQLINDARTRFRLWAPSCESVQLEIEGRLPLDMRACGAGWFNLDVDCGAGTLYRYRVADDLLVPDPASRFQPEDVHGPSQVIDPTRYVWRNTGWQGRPWEQAVLYELHVGALGGYRGVARKLPRLAELGITAIELMPLNDFPGARNWGYDGVLPFAPDSAYGTPDELKALIDTAHGLGLMVLLDVVYNHFGPEGNYLHSYAEAFFKRDVHTPWGPAIDFDRPEVRRFFIENALYWLLEYRFDGLRLDAVHAIGNDGWLRELSARVRGAVETGRHVHLVLENEHNTASLLETHFDAQWNDDAHNTLHALLTGETEGYYAAFAERAVDKLARVLAEGFVYQGEPSPIHDGAPRGEPSAGLRSTAFVLFLQNHDQIGNRAFGERLRSLAQPEALLAATALMLLSPQIPLLFMGEEWGSTQPFLFFTSYTDELGTSVRDGRRKEFARFGAFSDEARRARIPDPNDEETFVASCPPLRKTPVDGDAKWLDFYRRALAVRAAQIVPRLAGASALGATAIGDVAVLARWRMADGAVLAIALNLGPKAVALEDIPDGDAIFTSPADIAAHIGGGALPAYSCAVLLSALPGGAAHAGESAAQQGEPA